MRTFLASSALLIALPTAALTAHAASAAEPTVAAKAAAADTRSSSNTSILCLPSGESARVAKVKPAACNTLGPDDSFAGAVNLAKLKWKGWGGSTTTATGVEKGFGEKPDSIKVKVTLSAPKANDCGGFSYTKLKSTSSKYGSTTQKLPATCED